MMLYLSEGEEWEESYSSMLYQNQDETMWYNLPKLTCYEHNGPSCHWPKYIKPHVQVIHPNEMRLIVKKSTKNISINFQRKIHLKFNNFCSIGPKFVKWPATNLLAAQRGPHSLGGLRLNENKTDMYISM